MTTTPRSCRDLPRVNSRLRRHQETWRHCTRLLREMVARFSRPIESRLAADRRDAGPVTYALHEMGPDGDELPMGLEANGFIRLDLGMVTRGGYNVSQTDPGG